MVTVDNTKRKFSVSILTKVGMAYESKLQHSYAEMQNYQFSLEKNKSITLPISTTQTVTVACDMVACIIVNELLMDKLDSQSKILEN